MEECKFKNMPSGIYIRTEEYKEKVRNFFIGKKHTEEHNRRISESIKRAYDNPEARKKLSISAKKAGKGKWMKGRKLSEVAKMKLRKWKEEHKEETIGYSCLGAKAASEKYPTSIEKKVYQELKDRGYLFERQKIVNNKFCVDAYIPKLNLIIECDGDYFHSLDKIIKKDKAENAYLNKCGYNLLRLSETEINNEDFKKKLDLIKVE